MKGENIIIKDNTVVKKSNALARAIYPSDSVWVGRIVAIIASQVCRDDDDFKLYKIPIPDILAVTNVSRTGKIYNDLHIIAESLMGRVVKIEDDDGKGWSLYSLFSRITYRKGDGFLQARFDSDLKPHFLDLKKQFTMYSLAEYLSLPSTYSQRLYERLKSWSDCISNEINVTDLNEILGTPASMRSNFAEFRRGVLDKAYKDIHKHTKLKYEWEPIKKGRKVIKLRFVFGPKSKAKARARNKQIDNKKQSTKNNALFLTAVQCAADHPDGCGRLRGTKDCCKVCMEPKKHHRD